jgi:hypothetical protein
MVNGLKLPTNTPVLIMGAKIQRFWGKMKKKKKRMEFRVVFRNFAASNGQMIQKTERQ